MVQCHRDCGNLASIAASLAFSFLHGVKCICYASCSIKPCFCVAVELHDQSIASPTHCGLSCITLLSCCQCPQALAHNVSICNMSLSDMGIDPVMHCALSGEEEGEMFGEFEVSKEDLHLTRSGSHDETRRGSISSKRFGVTSNSSSGLIISLPAGMQIDLEACAKSPSCTSAHLCEQTAHRASGPPLSPSVDGSNDSPTLARSFTFAGEPALLLRVNNTYTGLCCACYAHSMALVMLCPALLRDSKCLRTRTASHS